MGYITQEGLTNLEEYQYKSGGMTWFDTKVNVFWEWVVKLMPKTIAPNLMTFVGWCCIIASYGCMLFYDFTFDHNIPRWCFFFAAFCIFSFITLDAIDGKQARRTKGGSPLGQLFDHGCDSYTLTFLMLGICEATQIDKSAVFFIFTITQIAFWTANWTQNHTGVLNTRVGQFGVTEGQHLCILVHILTGIFGQKIWQISPLSFLPSKFAVYRSSHSFLGSLLSMKLGTSIVYIFGTIILILTIQMFISTAMKSSNKFEAVSQYFSSILLVIMEVVWSKTRLYEVYSGLILVNFGFLASLILCKLIICTVTKMKVQRFHFQLVPCIIATIILLILDMVHASLFTMKIVFWILFVIDVVWVFSFLILTIRQITHHLNIRCFSLKKRNSKIPDPKYKGSNSELKQQKLPNQAKEQSKDGKQIKTA